MGGIKDILAKLFGGGLIKDIGEVADKFITTKQDKLEFQAAIQDKILQRELEAEKILNERLEIEAASVQSARDMQSKIATSKNSTKLSKNFVYYFITFWSIVGALTITMPLFLEIPSNNIRLIDTVFGFILGTALAAMFNFILGSSIGSKDKDEVFAGKFNKE